MGPGCPSPCNFIKMILCSFALLCQHSNALRLRIIKANAYETVQAQLQSAKPAPVFVSGSEGYELRSPVITCFTIFTLHGFNGNNPLFTEFAYIHSVNQLAISNGFSESALI